MKNFDNASTTKISKESLESYVSASECFYNASANYIGGAKAKQILEEARAYFLKYFKGKPNSTFLFTGSASESNNAVLNACIIRKDKKYIFGGGEHSSIHNAAKYYLEQGYNVKFLPLLKNGGVDIQALGRELDESVAFVSIMHVSNETGAYNDIETITNIVKSYNKNIIVHSDGVQAVGKLKINLKDLGVDYYTISAHKINGPKGVGALYVANPNKFKPFIIGGGQEMGLRAGTENLPGVCAFKTALENVKIKDFKEHKLAILKNLEGDFVCASDFDCVNNIISLCFKGVRGETIQHMMEAKGYIIGTGSACNSKIPTNRVISQIVPKEYVEGAIRLSFDDVSVEDCINIAKELSCIVKEYREKINRWKTLF